MCSCILFSEKEALNRCGDWKAKDAAKDAVKIKKWRSAAKDAIKMKDAAKEKKEQSAAEEPVVIKPSV